MLTKILAAIAVIFVIFAAIVAMQPSEFHIERSTTIAAEPKAVFAEVNDLHRWQAWSPWAKLDPNAKHSFEGPDAGVGAVMRWAGNNQVGEGSMTIMESVPDELIRLKLEFLKPFAATNTADFTFKKESGQTVVTWSMYGHNNFLGKAISLIMDCDKMVGEQFEKGLAQIKEIAEKAPKK